ncbi:T9SS type A sorting domain-containing protein [Formosa sediminum]|uniref:T9SS type A sorting domain-containing protein n=1 Tax=Formosa sediminum TaxID=2594004 RepID=A0A516GRF3_9FLAO|nr:LamG-like jellyroll fold domain-containing protein [Formosa sediminum]QDO94089.1 T9SS type A sorting domain-containing protein [Formosa sediminum]
MKKTLLKTFILFAFTNLSAQDITTGLVFNLGCNSDVNITDGETLTELSSNAATGTIVGEIKPIEGPDGNANSAFNFTSNSHINFVPAAITDLPLGDVSANGRSYALWIKTEIGDTRMQIFSYGTNLKSLHVHLNINQVTTNAGQLNLGFWNTETTQTGPFSTITDNKWHHIVAVVNKTEDGYTTDYYVDNELIETVNLITTDIVNTQIPTTGTAYVDFRIGGRNTEGASLSYTGGLDDVRLYNRALTATDVEALYLAKGNTLSVSEVETTNNFEFKVYPTITSEILNLKSNVNLEQLSIINLNGVVVKTIETPTEKISVSQLTNGLYFIVGKTASNTSTLKFIKK